MTPNTVKLILETDIQFSYQKCKSKWYEYRGGSGGLMILDATFNNISVISWWSVLLVEETGVPRENQ
jgi:hypothetical protein